QAQPEKPLVTPVFGYSPLGSRIDPFKTWPPSAGPRLASLLKRGTRCRGRFVQGPANGSKQVVSQPPARTRPAAWWHLARRSGSQKGHRISDIGYRRGSVGLSGLGMPVGRTGEQWMRDIGKRVVAEQDPRRQGTTGATA